MSILFSINSPLWRISDKALRLFWLSILWTVCSLPIFTIGASTTALYSVTLKYVRNEEGYLTSSFFRAFKQNFKQATLIWLAILMAAVILCFDFILYFRMNQSDPVQFLFLTIFFGIFVAFLMTSLFVYPLLAKFDNPVRRTLLNALVMAVCHIPSALLILIISFAVPVTGLLGFPPLLFLAPALTAYLNSCLFVKIFDHYLPAEAVTANHAENGKISCIQATH